VSPHFLDSIGVPIIRGRGITDQDTQGSEPVAVVNQEFVKRFYPKDDPIGKHFGIDLPQYSGAFQIVGVFHDFKMNNPRSETRPVFLRPLAQYYEGYKTWPGTGPAPSFMSAIIGGETQSMYIDAIIVNFQAAPQNAEELLRRTLASIDPNLTVIDVRTYDSQVQGNFTQDRLVARLTTLFGIVALVLASVGLYGVMSYFVARRTGEIGIRMALGATRSRVIGGVLRNALIQVGVGLIVGIPAALFAGHLMKSQLYGVGSYDPLAFVGAAVILAVCGLLAGLIPARRAASIEPMQALRTQ
jgi:predicted permease